MEAENTQMQLEFIDPSMVNLTMDAYKRIRFLNKEDGQSHDDVEIKLMFPLTHKSSFLAIYENDQEIALIQNYKELNPGSRTLVMELLDQRYFIPEIVKVKSVKEEYRLIHWYVETNRGELDFFTRTRNDIVVKANQVFIRDIDGNRYLIKDHTKLSPQSQRELSSEI